VPVGRSPIGLAVGLGSAWVANHEDATVSRVDQKTLRATTIKVPLSPSAIAVGHGSVWVVDPAGVVARIDPATNRVAESFDFAVETLTIAATEHWLLISSNDALLVVDPDTGRIDHRLPMKGISGLVARDGKVWACETLDVSVYEVDEATAKVTQKVELDTNSWGMTELDGALWVVQPAAAENKYAEYKPGTVTRLDR